VSAPAAIVGAGMATPVGLSAPAAAAGVRARIAGFAETRFMGADGEWLVGAETRLEEPWRGFEKLRRMAARALRECLALRRTAGEPALFLCVSETDRPGREEGLGGRLLGALSEDVGTGFDPCSAVFERGRAGGVDALRAARDFLAARPETEAVVLGVDSLLTAPALAKFVDDGRILGGRVTNGFIPGEAAAAVLLAASGADGALVVEGIGSAAEEAVLGSGKPLRADGLRAAIAAALDEAGRAMHDMHYRMTDLSGEHYYFREAALALARTLRRRVEEMDLEHPAECVGETGAAALPLMLGATLAAQRKGYARGPSVLVHLSADDGDRAAIVLRYKEKARGE